MFPQPTPEWSSLKDEKQRLGVGIHFMILVAHTQWKPVCTVAHLRFFIDQANAPGERRQDLMRVAQNPWTVWCVIVEFVHNMLILSDPDPCKGFWSTKLEGASTYGARTEVCLSLSKWHIACNPLFGLL
jgi:hypothetical protein